jgi:hypothetical protein
MPRTPELAEATDTTATAVAADTLLDRYLPTYDATRREHLVVDADAATVWGALVDLDVLRVHTPLVDAALWVRGLLMRLAGWLGRRPAPLPAKALRIGHEEPVEGWLGLGRRPGQELAFGAAGVFWTPDIRWFDVADPEAFATWHRPGTGRIVAAFQLQPYGRGRTLVSYEARTAMIDAAARRRFRWYWRIVSPFVGVIMRATLRTLREDAERETATVTA